MHKDDMITTLLVASIIVSVIALVAHGIYENMNPCLIDRHASVVSGRMVQPERGWFSSVGAKFYLTYAGKKKRSGDTCSTEKCVTETEYARAMYDYATEIIEREE